MRVRLHSASLLRARHNDMFATYTETFPKSSDVLLTVHLSIILAINQLNAQNVFFIISLLYACTCFEHYVLIIRRSKLYYTASGIITPVGGRPLHRLRADSAERIWLFSSYHKDAQSNTNQKYRETIYFYKPLETEGALCLLYIHLCFNIYFYTLLDLIVLKYRNPI